MRVVLWALCVGVACARILQNDLTWRKDGDVRWIDTSPGEGSLLTLPPSAVLEAAWWKRSLTPGQSDQLTRCCRQTGVRAETVDRSGWPSPIRVHLRFLSSSRYMDAGEIPAGKSFTIAGMMPGTHHLEASIRCGERVCATDGSLFSTIYARDKSTTTGAGFLSRVYLDHMITRRNPPLRSAENSPLERFLSPPFPTVCYVGSADKIDGIKTGWMGIMRQLGRAGIPVQFFTSDPPDRTHPSIVASLSSMGVPLGHIHPTGFPQDSPWAEVAVDATVHLVALARLAQVDAARGGGLFESFGAGNRSFWGLIPLLSTARRALCALHHLRDPPGQQADADAIRGGMLNVSLPVADRPATGSSSNDDIAQGMFGGRFLRHEQQWIQRLHLMAPFCEPLASGGRSRGWEYVGWLSTVLSEYLRQVRSCDVFVWASEFGPGDAFLAALAGMVGQRPAITEMCGLNNEFRAPYWQGISLVTAHSTFARDMTYKALESWGANACRSGRSSWGDAGAVSPGTMCETQPLSSSSSSSSSSSEGAVMPVHAINLGIDIDRFRLRMPEDTRRRRGLPLAHRERPWVVGSVGRLSPQKGLAVMIDAFQQAAAQLPRGTAELWVVGEGPLGPALETLVARKRLSAAVRLLGGHYGDDLIDLMEQMDVAVFPSLRPEEETLGLAGIEAMAVELPVVGFGTGGSSGFLLDGVNGRLVEEPTATALSEIVRCLPRSTWLFDPFTSACGEPLCMLGACWQLVDLANHPSEVTRLGTQARQFVERYFSLERAGSQYAALFRCLHQCSPVRKLEQSWDVDVASRMCIQRCTLE